jgi:hypothetical protein
MADQQLLLRCLERYTQWERPFLCQHCGTESSPRPPLRVKRTQAVIFQTQLVPMGCQAVLVAIRSASVMTSHKEAARHEGARDPHGVFDRGGDKLAVFHGCRCDHEVVHLGRFHAIRRGDNARAIAIDSVGSTNLQDLRPSDGRENREFRADYHGGVQGG